MKIAFFDIDGTLLNFGESDLHPCIKDALNSLHRNGTKLFLATGRPPYAVPRFDDIQFDGMLCFNGGYCCDTDGVISSEPMLHEDVMTIRKNAERLHMPILAASASRMGANFFEKNLDDYMQISHHTCNVIPDFENLIQEDIFQIMIGSSAELDERLQKNTHASVITRWWPRAVDVIPASCGKDKGMAAVLSHYGYAREDAIAFGDGGNDLSLIRYAGIGIAMGNAEQSVKDAADYVSDSCADDGVLKALQHFGLI